MECRKAYKPENGKIILEAKNINAEQIDSLSIHAE